MTNEESVDVSSALLSAFELFTLTLIKASVHSVRGKSPKRTIDSCFDINRLVEALFIACLQILFRSSLSPVRSSALSAKHVMNEKIRLPGKSSNFYK